MIWKRLKKLSPEEEEEYKKGLADLNLSWKDKLSMVIAAYLVLLLPALLILVLLSVLALWMFGII